MGKYSNHYPVKAEKAHTLQIKDEASALHTHTAQSGRSPNHWGEEFRVGSGGRKWFILVMTSGQTAGAAAGRVPPGTP